ncbi:Pentatricopeptide repeat-containing protein [Vitis vinifera]|uniref:Pentatricopeptide repeat-containing protein n=1 Tax=Vitis vinifera TaxID=29760 RepID=A0A438HHR9_VITVI|nr:Pentatricopeptide repeat-containing protein [Vitis vinifera]
MGKKWQAGSGRRKRKRRSGKNLRRKQAVLPSLEDSAESVNRGEEANNLRGVVDAFHLKHREYADGMTQKLGLKLSYCTEPEDFEPCDYAFAGVIIARVWLAALIRGWQLHAQLVQPCFDSIFPAGNALIVMHARCGVVEAA